MDPNNVSVGLAALAGLASFLSPCVLALVPAYLGYLGGRSVTPEGLVVQDRWVTFTHGVAFVLGFSLVFVTLGAAASAIGVLLYDARQWIARLGGVVVILFGLHTMGVVNIPFLNYDTRRQSAPAGGGLASSALMGVFFSAGWAPAWGRCWGGADPGLSGAAQPGVLLLSAYSAGLAVPFLLAALGVGRLAELMRRHAQTVRTVSVVTGVVMVIVGVLLLTGTLGQLARFGFFVDFGL
jgi:cytochrome c-type biogenesis protein